MPANIRDIEGVIASLTALASAARDQRAQLMARWREYLREGQAGLQRQADLFEGIYEDAVANLDLQAVRGLAAATLDQRKDEANRIQPVIDALVQHLTSPSFDLVLTYVFREALEIANGTLENFDVLRDRLTALAYDRASPSAILRARPVENEIDHAALSREFIERFPNATLAADRGGHRAQSPRSRGNRRVAFHS